MKKVITLALAAMVVVLGLASCNKKDGDKDAATTPATTTTAAEITTAADTTTEAVTTEADTTADSETLEGGFETSVEDGAVTFKTNLGYSISTPEKYGDLTTVTSGVFVVVSEDGKGSMNIMSSKYATSREADMKTFKTDAEASLKAMDANVKIDSYEATELAGTDAVVIEYSMLNSSYCQIVVFGEEDLYCITITASDMESDFAMDMVLSALTFELN